MDSESMRMENELPRLLHPTLRDFMSDILQMLHTKS